MAVHSTAIVDKSAELDSTVEIGAYAIVGAGVKIGSATRIYPHAYIGDGTTIGRECAIHPFAVVGHHPQDLVWDHSPSYTTIATGRSYARGPGASRTMPNRPR